MMPLDEAKQILLVHSLLLRRQRHRARIDWILALCALAIFAYVLHWLTQHSVTQDTHHYVTALVIASCLVVLPCVAFYHRERKNYHGNL